jgi:hypothetical protein
MNERINQLAEQCHHRYSEHNIDLEKFAELIVRECMSVVRSRRQICGAISANILKEHFGVEE